MQASTSNNNTTKETQQWKPQLTTIANVNNIAERPPTAMQAAKAQEIGLDTTATTANKHSASLFSTTTQHRKHSSEKSNNKRHRNHSVRLLSLAV
jgi:hypothetical protein